MSRASRPGRALVISHDVAAGEGHARHDADEVTVLVIERDSVPDVAAFDQVLLVGIADPSSLAVLASALLAAPGGPEVLVGGGVTPLGSLDDWTAALGGIGIAGFDDGALALAVVDRAGSGAGPVLYGLLATSVKVSPRLVAPAREAGPQPEEVPIKKKSVGPVPATAPTGWRQQVARVKSSRRSTLLAAAGVTMVVAVIMAVLGSFFGDAVIGAALGVLLMLVLAHAARAEQRGARESRSPRELVRLAAVISRQSALLEAHTEQLAALRTSTSINELATVDIAKSLVRDVS